MKHNKPEVILSQCRLLYSLYMMSYSTNWL